MNALLAAILISMVLLIYAEDCVYCPNGIRVPTGKKAKSNGCGTEEIARHVSPHVTKGMLACCDRHDICYTSCTKTKDECDNEFQNCIVWNIKRNIKEAFLKSLVEGLVAGLVTTEIGCKAYMDSQKEHCRCQ